MDESNVTSPARLRDVQGAEHVRLEVVARIAIRIRNRDECGEVKDEVAALDRLRDGLDVADVAEDDLDLGERCPARGARAGPRSLREL